MSDASVIVRMLGVEDHHLLERVAADVFDEPLQPALVAEFLGDARHHAAVALEDDLVVGMATAVHYVHPDKPAELWINEVGVAPRWQRRGVGRRLLQALFAHGHALGCTEAWVLTEKDNDAARGLYRDLAGAEDEVVMYGFVLDGPDARRVPD